MKVLHPKKLRAKAKASGGARSPELSFAAKLRLLRAAAAGQSQPRMTRELAEKVAIGSGRGKVDFTAFLRSLKK